jgi:surface carbohydrate biosynthesis protein (TIGR04326 family)
MRYLASRRQFRGAGAAALTGSRSKITCCTYLFNLHQDAARSGQLRTSYWATLHELLEREPYGANWLLLYIKHREVRTAAEGRRLVSSFNHPSQESAYAALDSALGWPAVRGALRDYLRIVRAAWRLRRARRHFTPTNSSLDFWPMLRQDWSRSLIGDAAIHNCLYLNLFEQTLSRLPRQTMGLYLQENISWEMAFVHLWKACGHGCLVGVPHSTVRYWDLRYFFDPRSFHRTGANDLPLPDLVALNGPAAVAAYCEGGFPRERIAEVEALRYLHLASRSNRPARSASPAAPLCVLVLGDYMPAPTAHQMQLLVQAARALPRDTRLIIKPHPACPIDARRYPSLKFEMATGALDALLADCDVAYTSNMTSAAVDAYCGAVPVVSSLDGSALNVSPLRGMTGVTYVTNPDELATALKAARGAEVPTAAGEYFFLDTGLPRWRRVLDLAHAPPNGGAHTSVRCVDLGDSKVPVLTT